MEQLKAKLKKQGGFTMVELLIVVAIIAVLVAVSIPMMNSAIEKSRHAVDQANVRDAIALVTVKYMTDEDFNPDQEYEYCVDENQQGYLDTTEDAGVEPKCQCSTHTGSGSLTVKLTPPAAGEVKPTIVTSWHYDTTDKMTQTGSNPST